jgi:hypothetical protein
VKGEPAKSGHDFVRPFIMTGGRTRVARTDLRFETLVERRAGVTPSSVVPSEQLKLLECSVGAVSVAELAAELGLVVGVVCVLINDLLDAGLLDVFTSDPDTIDLDMLTAMVDKIRSL